MPIYFSHVEKRAASGSHRRMHKFIVPLFLAAAITAPAQRFSFGLKTGIPVTEASPYQSAPYSIVDTGRWTVGPTVELRLIGGFSFEADALYRGFRREASAVFAEIQPGVNLVTLGASPAAYSSFLQDSKEWDVPVLLKYRFRTGALRPFVDAGAIFAHQTSDYTSTFQCLGSSDACASAYPGLSFQAQSTYNGAVVRRGPAAGVGVEFKYHRIRIAPEIRYTRLDRPFLNEVTVLAGFTF